MKILAIETSGPGGSAALSLDGDVREAGVAETREQTSQLLPLIDGLLDEAAIGLADLDAFAFGEGPGSFTGLRVAAAVAQGFGLAAGVPLVPVSSIAGLMQQAWRLHAATSALICIDARMSEIYWAHAKISDDVAVLTRAAAIGAPGDIVLPEPPFACVGDAFAAYPDELGEARERADGTWADCAPAARDLLPLAAALHRAGRHVEPTAALPTYLRDSTAWRRQ